MTKEECFLTNYDHPFVFEMELLIEYLESGQGIKKSIYDFKTQNCLKRVEIIKDVMF